MTPYKIVQLIFFLCITTSINAQSNYTKNQEKISNSLSDYFAMDRENIHIHLNKNIYLTNEQIWFKGYIIEKKKKIPYYESTNIYVELIAENGEEIQSQLYFAENSIFQGNIKLNKTLKSGKYYLRVFTNYMNNFSEDESSIYEITILNETENESTPMNSPNYKLTEISFFPESGTFLEGVSNTIGLKITDCNENGIEIKNGEILDSKGNIITNFTTNIFGYGKFEIKETEAKQYKAICSINENKIEKNLPLPTAKGITFSIDNYLVPNRTTIQLKTNAKSIDVGNKTSYSLVIQQNENVSFIDFSFKNNETEHTFILPSENILEGINTIHLFDSNLIKIGERIIYKQTQNVSDITLTGYEKTTDSIKMSFSTKISLANLSISIVPAESISNNNQQTIYSALQFDNHLCNSSKNLGYYLNDFTRKKQYELDNFLLTKKSKYDWDALLGNPPKTIFEFDRGLTVKGTINTEIKDIENYKVNMNSFGLGLNENTSLNSKNEFLFENVIAIDSTKIYFVILNKKGEKSAAKTYTQLLNNNRKFNKPFLQNFNKCPVSNIKSDYNKIPFPTVQGAIAIDSVVILAKRNKLNNVEKSGNRNSKAYKISGKDANSYRDILQFLSYNGFRINTVDNNITINDYNPNEILNITSRNRSIVATQNNYYRTTGPAVFIDDIFIQDYNILRGYGLETIDEIYTSNRGVYFNGTNGLINIYSKKTTLINNLIKNKSQSLLVKNGFQAINSFENLKYENVRDAGFISYGTIDWKQNIFTDENGNFKFSIPNFYQSKIKITVEGINSLGQIISTTKIIEIL